jgi:HK97 family phage major capsid protein
MVPWSALQTRDVFKATASAGGYMVGVDVVGAYDTLRPYSIVINEGGAQVLEGLRGDTVLPQVSGTASGGWLSSETAASTPSDPTFTAKTLVANSYAASTSISRHLRVAVEQAEPVVRRHLTRLIGQAIDEAVLNGSGASGQPEGLLTVTGTVAQSGTTLAQAGVTNMLQQAVDGGADDRRVIFISTAAVRELLQNRERVSTSGQYVWQNNELAGKPAYATRAMPAATMLCGDFTNVVIGLFGPGVELMVDPYTAFKTGVINVRAIVSCDVGVLFPPSFAKSSSIT